MKDALDETLILSDHIIQDLVAGIVVDIGALYKASEAVALLDMLWSFAHVSISMFSAKSASPYSLDAHRSGSPPHYQCAIMVRLSQCSSLSSLIYFILGSAARIHRHACYQSRPPSCPGNGTECWNNSAERCVLLRGVVLSNCTRPKVGFSSYSMILHLLASFLSMSGIEGSIMRPCAMLIANGFQARALTCARLVSLLSWL